MQTRSHTSNSGSRKRALLIKMAEPQYTQPNDTQPNEPPFSQRTPSGVLNYMLRALEAKRVIDPQETERLSVLERWGAISLTHKGLHFSVLNRWNSCQVGLVDSCQVGLVDTSLPEEDQTPIGVYSGKFPTTQQEADDLVAIIAKACA